MREDEQHSIYIHCTSNFLHAHSFISLIICDISQKGSRQRRFRNERLLKQLIILMHHKESTLAYKKFHLFGVFMTTVGTTGIFLEIKCVPLKGTNVTM